MIGVDTNVLVRLIINDDQQQHSLAKKFFAGLSADFPGFVSLTTVIETVWTLRRSYAMDAETVGRFINKLLSSREIIVQAPAVVRRGMRDALEAKADFADAVISHLGIDADCDYTVTFDRSAANLPGMLLLK